jgi:hypothetical protein
MPGVGRKAQDGDFVVGIALEPFSDENGTVLTLVK